MREEKGRESSKKKIMFKKLSQSKCNLLAQNLNSRDTERMTVI